ncbi:hypothetical protein A28LD_0782 [Idiomarina sp. A28L]|uniref:hypothetical protein n=1 Tax=Idiomarina sp. A28L TaxID=1036674 RepID=UPI0002138885|nr:hypothetical protein [Idiomarina sp. A28L]EGN75737.1 hypothetical protein A28LD_0782 [Idiomarina sp. A28L]
MAFLIRMIAVGMLAFLLTACASTDSASSASKSQPPPGVQDLSSEILNQYLIQGRTQVHDIQRWWGRPQAQGVSGDFQWYNYTYVGAAGTLPQNAGDTKMVTLTVYFMVDTGLLADYDLQVRVFPAHTLNR